MIDFNYYLCEPTYFPVGRECDEMNKFLKVISYEKVFDSIGIGGRVVDRFGPRRGAYREV